MPRKTILLQRGVSTSVGIRGAHVTVGACGVRKIVGLPGTGESWTSYQRHDASETAERHGSRIIYAVVLIVGLVILAAVIR